MKSYQTVLILILFWSCTFFLFACMNDLIHNWKEINFSNKYTMVVSVTWGEFYEVCSKCYQVRQWRDGGWGAGGRHYSLGHQSVINLIEKVKSASVEHRDMKPYKKYILQLLKQAVPEERKRFQEKVNKFVLENTNN